MATSLTHLVDHNAKGERDPSCVDNVQLALLASAVQDATEVEVCLIKPGTQATTRVIRNQNSIEGEGGNARRAFIKPRARTKGKVLLGIGNRCDNNMEFVVVEIIRRYGSYSFGRVRIGST